LLCLVLTGLAAARTSQESFRFGEVDLEFLDQIKQLDEKFEEQARRSGFLAQSGQ